MRHAQPCALKPHTDPHRNAPFSNTNAKRAMSNWSFDQLSTTCIAQGCAPKGHDTGHVRHYILSLPIH